MTNRQLEASMIVKDRALLNRKTAVLLSDMERRMKYLLDFLSDIGDELCDEDDKIALYVRTCASEQDVLFMLREINKLYTKI